MSTNDALGTALRNRNQETDFLLYDDFSFDRAAGAISATEADRGPGHRIALDGNSKMTIAGGKVVFATGAVGNFDPAIVYRGLFPRVPGRILKARVELSAGRVQIGWLSKFNWLDDDSFTASGHVLGNRRGSFDFNGGVLAIAPSASGSITVGAYSTGVEYEICVIMRALGTQYFIKGGAFTNWILLAVDAVSANTSAAPYIGQLGTTTVATVSELFLKSVPWLASPVLSDSFSLSNGPSTQGESDGLGHAEGVAGILGDGGGGKVWTAVAGLFTAGLDQWVYLPLSGRAIATVDCGKADIYATVKCTFSTDTMALIVRWVDEDNHIRFELTSTHCELIKVVSGTPTTVSSLAYTYVAGADLSVICEGTSFRRYYNGTAIGDVFTISDAVLQTSTTIGLRNTNVGNTFDDLAVYARGTESEYAIIDLLTGNYLLHDSFTIDRAAGSIGGTLADPGPGDRFVVTDANNKLSFVGGKAVIATGGVGQGNPAIWYRAFQRSAGLICKGAMSATSGGIYVGFSPQTFGQQGNSILVRPGNGTLLVIVNNAAGINVGATASATDYELITVLRASGVAFFIKGGAFTHWTLIWLSSKGTSLVQYPSFGSSSDTTTVGVVHYLQVLEERWFPAPLVSDGFSILGTSDGLGHAEGVAGIIGSGGEGLNYTNDTGDWTTSGGVAYSVNPGMGADDMYHVDTNVADVVAKVMLTRIAGEGGIIVRYVDGANYVKGIHNGTHAKLVKIIAGTPTTILNVPTTYVVGAEIGIICEGTKFRLIYNDLVITGEQTISDAVLQGGTHQGMVVVDGVGNTFDNFVVYARGTDGEYVALD